MLCSPDVSERLSCQDDWIPPTTSFQTSYPALRTVLRTVLRTRPINVTKARGQRRFQNEDVWSGDAAQIRGVRCEMAFLFWREDSDRTRRGQCSSMRGLDVGNNILHVLPSGTNAASFCSGASRENWGQQQCWEANVMRASSGD